VRFARGLELRCELIIRRPSIAQRPLQGPGLGLQRGELGFELSETDLEAIRLDDGGLRLGLQCGGLGLQCALQCGGVGVTSLSR